MGKHIVTNPNGLAYKTCGKLRAGGGKTEGWSNRRELAPTKNYKNLYINLHTNSGLGLIQLAELTTARIESIPTL